MNIRSLVSAFSFVAYNTNDELQSDLFVPVEVADDAHPNVSMTIDGHCIEFDPALLDRIIGALK